MIVFPENLPSIDVDLLSRIVGETLRSVVVLGVIPEFHVEKFGSEPVPLFVRLFLNGKLRGEAGRIYNTEDLVRDVAGAVAAAAVQDVRFPPVKREELNGMEIHLCFLNQEEGEEGFYIRYESYSSFLFPWEREGNESVDLRRACGKAGIHTNCWKDSRTEVVRFRTRCYAVPIL